VLPDYLRGERFANLTSAHFNDEQGEQVSTVHLATDTITVALCADTRTVRRIWPSVEYRYSSHIRTAPGSGAYLVAGRTDEAITLLKQTLDVAKARTCTSGTSAHPCADDPFALRFPGHQWEQCPGREAHTLSRSAAARSPWVGTVRELLPAVGASCLACGA
jgi:hypothetical protein